MYIPTNIASKGESSSMLKSQNHKKLNSKQSIIITVRYVYIRHTRSHPRPGMGVDP